MAKEQLRAVVSKACKEDLKTLAAGRVNEGAVIEALVANANTTGFAPFGLAVIRQDLKETPSNAEK